MEALEQCVCPGCDRCMPPGGPCIRRMVSELDGRCQECYLSPPMGLPDEGGRVMGYLYKVGKTW
jgi:hypothetical protein